MYCIFYVLTFFVPIRKPYTLYNKQNYRLTRVPVDVDFVAIIDNQYVPSGLQTSPGAVLKILHPTEWFLIVAAVIAVALLYVLLRSSSTAFSRSYASGSDT